MPSDSERVAADPALLAEARRRYTGRGDLADRLWWDAHPGVPTATGEPDPRVAVDDLRRSLYRPGSPAETAEELRSREDADEADRAAARHAVEQALAAAPPPHAFPSRRGDRRGTRVGTLAAVVVALLVGVLIGHVSATSQPPPSAPALRAFDRPQRVLDRAPASALPSFVQPGSARRIRGLSAVGTEIYGVRTVDRRVCLVAVVLATRTAASCTTDAAFAAAGLTLVIRADADPVDDSGRRPSDELELHWEPDGDLGITPTLRD